MAQLCSYRYLYVSSCTAVYTRAVFGSLRFPLGKKCEDYYLQHQVFASANRVAYTARPFYHYVQRPRSISRSAQVLLEPLYASESRRAFYQAHFPGIAYAAEGDCAIASMSVYSEYVRKGVVCPLNTRRKLQKTSRGYLCSALRNRRLPGIKKAQLLTFCCFPGLYRFVIKRKEHR